MEGVMDTFDDEAFHVDPRMKTKAQVRTDQNGKEEDSRSAAWVQTYEVLVGVWMIFAYIPMRRMTTLANIISSTHSRTR
ncbi:hypothetical protein Syun_012783 [Stephania yunnanensis]|uniref:Uncharacterized protein n=1 Tax=Stephania yunnanensis TaxID=152371 RepID=A0AAP0K020_9MAGN